MIKLVSLIALVTVLSGCVAPPSTSNSIKKLPASAQPVAAATVEDQKEGNRVNRISQCHSELEALKTFDGASYQKYRSEFDRISAQTQKYLKIKPGLGSDINDLAMPKYQFAVRDVCFRIRTDLAKAMISL